VFPVSDVEKKNQVQLIRIRSILSTKLCQKVQHHDGIQFHGKYFTEFKFCQEIEILEGIC